VRNGKIEAAHIMTVGLGDRPPRRRRRARRPALWRVQAADREPGDDGGVNIDIIDTIGNDKTTGSDAMGKDVGGRKQMIARRVLLTGMAAAALTALTRAGRARARSKYPAAQIRIVCRSRPEPPPTCWRGCSRTA
jgi:hypothetical protein